MHVRLHTHTMGGESLVIVVGKESVRHSLFYNDLQCRSVLSAGRQLVVRSEQE